MSSSSRLTSPRNVSARRRMFDNTQEWIYELDNPYLHGAYAPTTDEIEAQRTGGNRRAAGGPVWRLLSQWSQIRCLSRRMLYHPFDGDGMVHAVYIRDGKASYRNSYIHTAALQHELAANEAVWPGVMGPFDFSLPDFPIKDTGNTDVILFNGSLIPTWYNAGIPYAMDPLTLQNQGMLQIDGRQRRNMSAHSHVDWNTGELIFMDYGDEAPFMTYGVANPDGTLRQEVPIQLPGPRLPHDLGFTTNFTILHDLPFFHDVNVLRNHNMRVLKFHRDIPTRFGVIPRYGGSDDIRWFECEPCFILHVSNCWEEGEWIVMDGCRSINPMPDASNDEGALSHMLAYMRLEANNYRWRFNLRTGEVREGDIDDLNTEFNKINQIYQGIKSKYAYHQRIPLLAEGGHTLRFTGLVKYNNETGQYDQWDYGEGVYGSETPFAPVKGATRDNAEDDGYVVSLVTDSNTWKSELQIFDAKDITVGPIARVKIPQRVPVGFHAWWSCGEQLWK